MTTVLTRRLPYVGLLALLASGCNSEAAVARSEVTVSDSSGVTLVDVGPLPEVAAPDWRLDRVFSTSRTGVEFFRVTSGRILAENRVIVGDGGNDELLMLDARGRVVQRLGRTGDGPGEFRAITSVHASDGLGFTVYDTRLGRWTRFDSGGAVHSTEAMRPPNPVVDLEPLAIGSAGELLAIYGSMRRFAREGIRRDTTPLLRYGQISSVPDTIGLWPSAEWSYTSTGGGSGRSYVGFARSLASFGRGELAVLGDTDSLSISVFDATGAERMRIRGGGARLATTQAEGERWREMTASGLSSSAPEELRDRFLQAPFWGSYPAFDAVAVDAGGRVWVGATATLLSTTRLWIIFNGDGSAGGRVELPADATILDIAHGRILLRQVDDMGVHTVALHEIEEGR